MKKIILLCAVVLGLSSCAIIGTNVGTGFLLTDVTGPEAVTSNPVGTKVGTASAANVLGIVATGDVSIQTAANSAGIKKISHIDSKKFSVLGIYSTYKIFVYGE